MEISWWSLFTGSSFTGAAAALQCLLLSFYHGCFSALPVTGEYQFDSVASCGFGVQRVCWDVGVVTGSDLELLIEVVSDPERARAPDAVGDCVGRMDVGWQSYVGLDDEPAEHDLPGDGGIDRLLGHHSLVLVTVDFGTADSQLTDVAHIVIPWLRR